jgi:isopenicillin-N N-acyltransferase-like protein
MRALTISGSPAERGRAYGEELREEIHRGVGRFRQSLAEQLGADPDAYLREFLDGVDFDDAIAAWAPDALTELRGVADGCGLPFESIYAYNLVDELWLWAEERGDPLVTGESPPGCTVLGMERGPSGAPLIAQTMDIPLHYCDTEVALRIQYEDRPELWTITPAGMLNTFGWNEAGVGVCTNTIMGLSHARHGLPMLYVVRVILAERTREDAAARVRALPHASGQAYTIGDPTGVTSLECSATSVVEYGAGLPLLVHANHPLVNEDLDSRLAAVELDESQGRQAFAEAAVVRDVDGIKRLLADRTLPICKVGSKLSDTTSWASIVMELTAPPHVVASVGPPPHRAPYERVTAA